MAEVKSNGAATATTSESSVLIVDMGKKKRKQIKRLRRGGGKLMEQIGETMEQLHKEGEISADSPVVVVIVREKRKKAGWMTW
jgi:hypothetical protein